MKKLIATLFAISLAFVPVTHASTFGGINANQGGTGYTSIDSYGWLSGNGTGALRLNASTSPTVGWLTGTSTTVASTFSKLTVTGVSGLTLSSMTGSTCLRQVNGVVTAALTDCGSGGGGGGTFSTSTNTTGVLNNFPSNTTDIVEIGGNSTSTAPFYFNPNNRAAMFGGGNPQTTSLGTGFDPLGISTTSNDIVNIDLTNRSMGGQAAFCINMQNGSTTTTFPGTYYGDLCFFGSGWDGSLGSAGKPHSVALYASDGRLVLGTATSSEIDFYASGNSSLGSGSMDAVMKGTSSGGVNFGLSTSSPYAALSVVGSTGVVADHYTATSTTVASAFPKLTVSGSGGLTLSAMSGTTCLKQVNGVVTAAASDCGSGGGGSGGGTFSTSTAYTGVLNNYANNATDVVEVGGTSGTSTAKFYYDPNSQIGYYTGSFYTGVQTLATSTSMSMDLCLASTTNQMGVGVGAGNITLTITNANNCVNKSAYISLIAPNGTVNIATTTFAAGTASGPIIYAGPGNANPGSPVVNGVTYTYRLTSMSTSTPSVPFISVTLVNAI